MCNLPLFITEPNIANFEDETILHGDETNVIEEQIKMGTEPLKTFLWFWNNYVTCNR